MFTSRRWVLLAVIGFSAVVYSTAMFSAATFNGAVMAMQDGDPAEQMARAKTFSEQGNWKQASEIYAKLSKDAAVESKIAASALSNLAMSLYQLNQVAQLDGALKASIEARSKDWRILQTAARLLTETQHHGVVANQQFTRGYSQRNGGVYIQTIDQDRLQALNWLLSASATATESGIETASVEFAELQIALADLLILGRSGQQAWQLQALTDLDSKPDYLDLESPRFVPARNAPADGDQPVLYSKPESFEAAKSDGERYRWALEQAQSNPQARLTAVRRWADFLHSQFAVDTLQQEMWLFQRSADSNDSDGNNIKDREEGIAAIHTLADDETIAKLSSGIHRFKLADEFNPIFQYQQLADSESRSDAEPALESLKEYFLESSAVFQSG